ncbi:MAG: hypothetical protein JO042_07550 [Sinobacteraceae bacterium]|nr:hypothetical protein [Nevskiaceae bacterium]
MASDTYIVRLLRANEHATLKHILDKPTAIQYAQQHLDGADCVEVYRIGTTNTREAMATVQAGRAELIASYGKKLKRSR